MDKRLITIVELPEFQKFAKDWLSKKECIEVINYIAANPSEGSIIRGTGDIGKLRFALTNNKGKSGGMRVIYFYHNENMPVFLITCFIKSKLENITQDSCNKLKKLSEVLVKLYSKKEKNEQKRF